MFSSLFKQASEDGPRNQYDAESQFNETWGFYQSFYSVGGQNILNINKVTKMPVLEYLTALSFLKDLANVEQARRNKNKRQ